MPAVETATLPNGLELAVIEMHKVPVVDVPLLVHAGAVRDPQDLPGLATFTANMLDEGAGRRSALEIAEEADYLGATLSTGQRAGASPCRLSRPGPKSNHVRTSPAMAVSARSA